MPRWPATDRMCKRMDLVLTNARVVTPDRVTKGHVAVVQGRIAAVGDGGSDAAGAIDLDGDFLIPGLIDLHTDHLERHFSPRPGVHWDGVAAAMSHDAQIACAGITTVYDSLALIGGRETNDRHQVMGPMIDGLSRAVAGRMLRADHRLHLRCEVVEHDVVERFSAYLDNPLLQLVSVMDHSPGQRQFTNIETYKKAHMRVLKLNAEEMDRMVVERMAASREHGPTNRTRLAELAREHGLAFASHDDETGEHVAESAALGVTIAEFPTTVTAAAACRANGMHIVMGAPNLVRGGSHSGNVAAADLAARGLLDILSSDYVPFSMLQAAFALSGPPHGHDLPSAIATVTRNPARAAGLDDRGAIEEGLNADLVRVSLVGGMPVVRAVWHNGERVA